MTDIVHVDAHTREGGKVDVTQHYRGLPNNGASAPMTEAEYNYAKKLYISKIISLYGECNGARTREEQIIINNANDIISNFKIECAKSLLKEAIRFEEKARNLDQDEDYRAIRKINDIAYENDEALFATMSDWFVFGNGKPYIFTKKEQEQIFNQKKVRETTDEIEESFIMRISGRDSFGKLGNIDNRIWNERIDNLKDGETLEFYDIKMVNSFTSEDIIKEGFVENVIKHLYESTKYGYSLLIPIIFPTNMMRKHKLNNNFMENADLGFIGNIAAKTPYAETIFTLGSAKVISTFSGRVTKNNEFFDINYDIIHSIDDIYDFNNESETKKDKRRNNASLYKYYSNLQQKGLGKPYEINIEKKEKKRIAPL